MSLPDIQQKTWEDVIQFFARRLSNKGDLKRDHGPWLNREPVGEFLCDAWKKARQDPDRFAKAVRDRFGLPTPSPN